MCFFDKYNALCQSRGKSANAVAKELGLSSGVVTLWKQNGTTPRSETLKKVADYFHVSVDFLTNSETDPVAKYDNDLAVLASIFPDLSPENRRLLVGIAKEMHKQEG